MFRRDPVADTGQMGDLGSHELRRAGSGAGPSFVLRRGTPLDSPIVRMLLGAPPARRRAVPTAWLACSSDSARVLGAARLSCRRRVATFWVRVVRPYRRAGVGRALLDAVMDHARARGVIGLTTRRPVSEPSGERLLGPSGFRPLRRFVTYEGSLSSVSRLVGRYHQRLVARGRVPADVRLPSLAEVDDPDLRAQAIRLLCEHLGARPARLARRLRGEGPQACEASASILLVRGGRVLGVGLLRRRGDLRIADSIVVDPAVRGGWASVVLRLEWVRRALAAGAGDRWRFVVRDDLRDTRRFAARIEATVVSRRSTYRLDLTPASGG